MSSILRLFKAVEVKNKKDRKAPKEILEATIRRGFIFSPIVCGNFTDKELNQLILTVEKEIGLTPEQMNASFHKSFGKVKDASIEQLFFEQIIHYFTTYGFEALGIYNKDSVYIPNEKLEIPSLKEGVYLTVIHGYTKQELKAKLLTLLGTGIALKDETLTDVVDLATYLDVTGNEVEAIRNKEVRVVLYDYLGVVPTQPVEFLRYVVYKATEKTLLIKNPATINQIKSRNNIDILSLFVKYEKANGLERLATIFYRFKPLFLAFKTNTQLKHTINKIRKLAKKHHKPMEQDYLNMITANIGKGKQIKKAKLKQELEQVNIFRKIRLAYALKFRTGDVDSILYKIRNGKAYAKEFSFHNKEEAEKVFNEVYKSIVDDIKSNVKGKKIYIPSYITYALPATEKQFTGDLPSGTFITTDKDMVAGVHWINVNSRRIDIDLSLVNADDKIGWDGRYRSDDRKVLFSGDLTDAPKPRGASELFYVARNTDNTYLMFANYFNYDKDVPVPMDIVVGKERAINIDKSYTLNPNNVLCVAKTKLTEKQKVVGLLVVTEDECKFCFSETNLGNKITSSSSPFSEYARRYLIDFYTQAISLNDALVKAGAKLVDDKEECDIDLSPQSLEKDTIINLITPR